MIDYDKIKRLIDDRLMSYNLISDEFRKVEPEELTKPEPKYAVGDTVFWMFDETIYHGDIIYRHDCSRYQIQMDCSEINLDEEQLYPTREDLIQSQIKYWTEMLELDENEGGDE